MNETAPELLSLHTTTNRRCSQTNEFSRKTRRNCPGCALRPLLSPVRETLRLRPFLPPPKTVPTGNATEPLLPSVPSLHGVPSLDGRTAVVCGALVFDCTRPCSTVIDNDATGCARRVAPHNCSSDVCKQGGPLFLLPEPRHDLVDRPTPTRHRALQCRDGPHCGPCSPREQARTVAWMTDGYLSITGPVRPIVSARHRQPICRLHCIATTLHCIALQDLSIRATRTLGPPWRLSPTSRWLPLFTLMVFTMWQTTQNTVLALNAFQRPFVEVPRSTLLAEAVCHLVFNPKASTHNTLFL